MMKSKIKEHVFGYDVFKENIPFSKLEENDVLLTPYDEFKRNHNWSFLSMNDDYIELIDQSYARLGKGLSPFIFVIPLMLIALYFLYLYFTLGGDSNDSIFITFLIVTSVVFIIWFCFFVFFRPFFKYDYKKPLCKPILFNRKTGKVFFY